MPSPVSKKQMRYMFAVLNSKHGTSSRGDRVPESVAHKYAHQGASEEDLPDSKGKEQEGGRWDEKGHKKAKERVSEKRTERKKAKAKLRKAYMEWAYGGSFRDLNGAGVIVEKDGKILVGKEKDGFLTFPGGHVEIHECAEETAKRELKEEAGLIANTIAGFGSRKINEDCGEDKTESWFVVNDFSGTVGKDTDGEVSNWKWMKPEDVESDSLRECCSAMFFAYLKSNYVKKSLKTMLTCEKLEKNIIRAQVGSGVVHEMRHGEALKLVGNGTFRLLRNVTKDMGDEDFKDFQLDNYTVSVRKHANDVYSGRITDGHKLVHQWTNRSLPAMAAELMSVFEWYMPEDGPELEIMDENKLPDDAIHGGFQKLIDDYKKHNIENIYSEMENIRAEIRNGAAVDLQQVEQRIMKLFDKLESSVLNTVGQHNKLCEDVGSEIDEIHSKLVDLQSRLDEMAKKPAKVEAFSANPANPNVVHSEGYMYLPKPSVIITPDGRITITFAQEWTSMERENFLKDMKAKALKKGSK